MTAPRILAAIDVGTNSIHMVVARIQPQIPAFTIVAKEKTTVRLGDRDPQTGDLTVAAMDRAVKALRRCQTLAQSLQAEQIIAVATSAVREAGNGAEFLQRVKEELGLRVDLIAGTEEARRIYLGVLSGLEFNHHPHVIIDIGGGSTELILGSGHEPRSLSSTKVGAVRLSALFIQSDPISAKEFNALQAYIRGMLERPAEDLLQHLEPGEVPRLIGTSGTIEAVASLLAAEQQGAVPERLNGYQVNLKDIQSLIQRLRKMTYAQRSELPGMSDRRAEIIVAGALILQEAMTLLQLDAICLCERALREGIVVDWMLTHGLISDRLRYQTSVRQRSVLHAAHKFRVDLEHGERVAQFSLDLFDQLRGSLHQLDDSARELLWAAAILHNCGHYVSHGAHHKHSYYLIRNGELLGYTEGEIEAIANLARYHRKSGPKRKHENYRRLTSKTLRQVVDQLHPMLRLAVALDRRQLGAIAQLRCEMDVDRQQLYLHLEPQDPQDDCALELWSLEQKKGEFEKAFGVKIIPLLNTASVH